MGRFDALTQLEKKPANPQTGKWENPQEVKPVSPQTRLSANPQDGKPTSVKVEKYTTRLEPGLIKQIKQYAVTNDMKDYEVVQQAIIAYLASKK